MTWYKYIVVAGASGLSYVAGTIFSGKNPPVIQTTVETHTVDSVSTNYVRWFNAGASLDKRLFPYPVDTNTYLDFAKNIKYLWGDSTVTLPFFIGGFCIAYNEVGSDLKSKSEYGTDEYFFNRSFLQYAGKWKISYNAKVWNQRYQRWIQPLGNIPAGDYLVSKGLLHPVKDSARVNRWNGDVYPNDEPYNIRIAARNADFYKFRGHGYIQITGRGNFERYAKPVIPNLESLTHTEMSNLFLDAKVALSVCRNYLMCDKTKLAAQLNRPNPNWDALGRLISGTNDYAHFKQRCSVIYSAVRNDGFMKVFYPNRNTVADSLRNEQKLNERDSLNSVVLK